MEISASMIKELKDKTGAGVVDCKACLSETGGDLEKAVDILRKKGLAKAAKKEGRAANEGTVAYKVAGKKGLLLKVNCETDFVAKTEDFKKFTQQILEAVFQKGYTFSAELPADIEEIRKNAVAKLGENILVSEWQFLEAQGELYPYVHLNKVAAIADFASGSNPKGADLDNAMKNVAMQITAMNPIAVDPSAIPADRLAKEKDIFTEEAKATGKPEKVIENIVKGKLEKWYSETVLLEQAFILDEEKKVKDYFAAQIKNGFAVKGFIRVSL
jgi:elongation factor Ts